MARGVTLTKDQEYALESTIARIRRADFMSDEPGKYEFKQLEVRPAYKGTIELRTTVGLRGDEGTMASVFARTSRQVFIGPKGGLSAVKFGGKGGKSTVVRGRSALYDSRLG